jgi:glutamate transport system permease protein
MSATAMYDVMGPRAERRVRRFTATGAAAVAVLAALALWQLWTNGLLRWDVWSILANRDFARLMFAGAWATLQVALVAIVLSFAGGLGLALCAMSDSKALRYATKVWIEIFRGIPLLVLIFFLYLGLPAIGIVLTPFWSLVLGIALYNSAVMCEILRSGANALPRGQSEAAYALGFRKAQVMAKVVLPQAIKIMLPALVSQMVIVLKESSLGFVIGYGELLRNGRITVDYSGTIHAIPVYITIALLYLTINLVLSRVAREIQRRNARVPAT